MEKVGSDDGSTRLPEEYKELEKVLCMLEQLLSSITVNKNYQQETDATQKIIEDLIAKTNEMLHPNPG